jgi:branched-chain amino acid transport system ATP-binding protein
VRTGSAEHDGSPNGHALELRNVTAGYRGTTVLRGVNITVPKASVVALLGPNGAGKTTALRVASGLLRPSGGEVLLDEVDVTRAAPFVRARRGLCLIPEGRGVFRNLTVRDNLRLKVPPGQPFDEAVDKALHAFPVLGERMDQLAGRMSGGQQQMLALARAFVTQPSVVVVDEVSMGLAPRLVDDIFVALRQLAASGASLLVVEQYVNQALEIADAVAVLEKGEIIFSGPAKDIDGATLVGRYLGIQSDGSV